MALAIFHDYIAYSEGLNNVILFVKFIIKNSILLTQNLKKTFVFETKCHFRVGSELMSYFSVKLLAIKSAFAGKGRHPKFKLN